MDAFADTSMDNDSGTCAFRLTCCRRARFKQSFVHTLQTSYRFSILWQSRTGISFSLILQARTEAKNSKKWILITVTDRAEFGCLALNRDLWSDEDVKDLIKEHFIFLYASLENHLTE